MEQQDRISYSFGVKVNLGNYESADAHFSYSTDVRASETPEKALKRAIDFVEKQAGEKLDELRSLKIK